MHATFGLLSSKQKQNFLTGGTGGGAGPVSGEGKQLPFAYPGFLLNITFFIFNEKIWFKQQVFLTIIF